MSPNTVEIDESLEGFYAGGVTRFASFALDAGLSFGLFAGGVAVFSWFLDLFFQVKLNPEHGGLLWGIPLLIWEFTYYWYCLTLSGKTPGCALLGIRVVQDTGAPITGRKAALRTIVFPLSLMFFGIGFIGILFGRKRRALHDVIARTGVVYDWDARSARLRFLARRATAAEVT
jgi:uncharacterized RDD family membrane protein YckC